MCFYDFAYEKHRKPVYAVSALEALVRGKRIADALDRVVEIEARLVVEGTLLLAAASVLHRAAGFVDGDAQAALYRRVVAMVEVAWIDASALPSVRASALVAAGFSYEHMGMPADALRSFERAVAVHASEGPLLAHGLALLAMNRRQAVVLFVLAAKQHTQFDWPYLYAAQAALGDQRFAEAEQFCMAGLELSNRPELRGRFYEWSAIAGANLGRPKEEVRELFDLALAETPFDPTIRKNAAAFAEVAAGHPWEIVPPPSGTAPDIMALEAAVTRLERHTPPELSAAA